MIKWSSGKVVPGVEININDPAPSSKPIADASNNESSLSLYFCSHAYLHITNRARNANEAHSADVQAPS
jgi:hypothetical protein